MKINKILAVSCSIRYGGPWGFRLRGFSDKVSLQLWRYSPRSTVTWTNLNEVTFQSHAYVLVTQLNKIFCGSGSTAEPKEAYTDWIKSNDRTGKVSPRFEFSKPRGPPLLLPWSWNRLVKVLSVLKSRLTESNCRNGKDFNYWDGSGEDCRVSLFLECRRCLQELRERGNRYAGMTIITQTWVATSAVHHFRHAGFLVIYEMRGIWMECDNCK